MYVWVYVNNAGRQNQVAVAPPSESQLKKTE